MSCVAKNSSLKDRCSTQVIVEKSSEAVVKKNTSLPASKKMTFAQIKTGDRAIINSVELSKGCGIGMGASTTKMLYHWYTKCQ